MKVTNECLNEWNATLEALGQGKQSIMIRKYITKIPETLLYPTIAYADKNNYLNGFSDEFKSFAKKYSVIKEKENKKEVKYFAKIRQVIQVPANEIDKIYNYHIWTNEHVNSYLNGNNAFIWLLQVYELENPVMLSKGNGMIFAHANADVSLDNIKPVLKDKEFFEIENKLNELL